MAVQKNKTSKLVLKVVTEVGAGGEKTYANRTISNITPDITDDIALQVGTRLAGLQAHSLDTTKRTNTYDLAAE